MVVDAEQAEQYWQYTTTYHVSNLDYAVITNSKDMVLKLIEAGADTNLTNGSGRTAFNEAE